MKHETNKYTEKSHKISNKNRPSLKIIVRKIIIKITHTYNLFK